MNDRISFLKPILDSINDSLVFINVEGIITFCNNSFEKLYGREAKQIIEHRYNNVFKEKELLKAIKKEKKIIERKITIENRNIYFNNIPYVNKGRLIGTVLIFNDTNTRRESEPQLEELKNSLEMIKDILDHAYQGIVLVDANGRIIKWNYEKLFGLKEEEVLGRPVQEVIENTRMHIVAKTGKKELCEVQRIQGHDMIASRTPIIKNGKVIGAVGTVLFKDVKELKSLARRLRLLESKFDLYKGDIKRLQEARYSFDSIITQNKRMIHLKEIARRASESNSTILIQGESGTGKELFAHAIHKSSYRKYGAFIRINCAAIPKELLESELFGYDEGAFTGARREGKLGKFELANGGTILLDEIGAMPLDMQAKLLRVIEEREFERIGGTRRVELDIRIISSTNEDLEESVKRGKFRKDLFYRLNVIRLEIPALRERVDDIPILTEHILKELIEKHDMEENTVAEETIDKLKQHDWPGNVRELRNVIERALHMSTGKIIYPEHLSEYLLPSAPLSHREDNEDISLKKIVEKAEIKAIKEALRRSNGNRTLAAKKLKIHRTALYKKIEGYGLSISDL
ncbi:MAG: PAS domain S-box protein [Firmicutes bacterium]|nr:PAS domain S-box protein [Bacillota bacterium]